MAAVDPELERLFAASQAETDHASAAAHQRRQVVLALRADGRLRSAAEQFAAASVLVHGEAAAELEAAQAMALAAMTAEPRARLLAATAFDRLRLLAGRPQKYGTQVVRRDGRAELWTVDPLTTDSERAKWDVPPLAELRRRAERGP
jgi:hypothetical protein